MMSSLLFYHKKGENPSLSPLRMRGAGGLKRFCSELISTVRKTATSESREPGEGEMTRHCAISVDVTGVKPARRWTSNVLSPYLAHPDHSVLKTLVFSM